MNTTNIRFPRLNRSLTEFRKTWTPPPSSPDEFSTEAAGVERAAFQCWKLRRQGRVAAVSGPFGHDFIDEWLTGYCPMLVAPYVGLLSREPTGASLMLPFTMQGGEFSVSFTTRQGQDKRGDQRLELDKRLCVQSEHGIHHGELIAGCSEISWMLWEVVSLPPGTPQDVADRLARAWHAIVDVTLPTDYATVMPLHDRCGYCNRPLTDQVSKTLGLGPDCAHYLGVSHSAEAANEIITKRQAFFARLERT